jgi:typhasterol/6-deoxotyphasterol 2alpha-hydroxylase
MPVHPAGPMLAPHLSREDTSVGGYDIPAGTVVLGRDPMTWDAPEEFRPERFVGSNIDVKGHNFELLPFGSGRRMCPGYTLGLKMMMLSLPDGVTKEELNMEETYQLVTPRKVPLVAVVGPNLPARLYSTA